MDHLSFVENTQPILPIVHAWLLYGVLLCLGTPQIVRDTCVMNWLAIALSYALLVAAASYYASRNCSLKAVSSSYAVQCTVPGFEAYQGTAN